MPQPIDRRGVTRQARRDWLSRGYGAASAARNSAWTSAFIAGDLEPQRDRMLIVIGRNQQLELQGRRATRGHAAREVEALLDQLVVAALSLAS
jgi:hypothetical protein